MARKKVVFVIRKSVNVRKLWSGTVFSLYNELIKNYEIENLYVKESVVEKVKRRLNYIFHTDFFKEDCQCKLIQQAQKSYIRRYKNEKHIVFQLFEAPMTDNTINFIYQDLCVEYLIDLKKNEPGIFAKTEFHAFSEKDMLKRAIRQQSFYQNCEAVFTMGQWQADYIVENCRIDREKVLAVGGGVNLDVTKYSPTKRNKKRFLFVGRNFERKGGCIVLEAFNRLRTNYIYDAQLYVVGCHSHKYNHMDGVYFIGDVSSSEIVDYYNMCDVFCMPSYFEAYGIAFIEALCFAMPCIGRNCNEMPYIIKEGQNGYLINSDDVDELCSKMLLALDNDTMHKYLEQKRTEYIKEYSWENVVNKMKRVIDEKAKIDV